MVSTLSADRFRGQVRHEFLDQIPVGGAQLEMVDANDPSQSITLFTDALGYFETTVFDNGDQVNITATHPAYQQETPVVTLASTDHFESILMTPLGDVTTDYHDIIVQISGAVTQLPLRNVPIEITQWDDNNQVIATYNVTTDNKGIAVQRGVRNGSYAFKINDSSLPDAERQPRYEDYATPPLQRVSITQNHFTNVFLKPLKQDLRVVVKGYNFKTKEDDVPLGDVLVEIRGLDPHDTDVEVLHPRSEYTKLFTAPPPTTITDDEILISDGEAVFQGLPPAAYEVRVTRYGYRTQRILLEPNSVTGLLPNSLDVPLAVTLPRENHQVDVLVDYADFKKVTFDQNGFIASSGVTGLSLKVRIVGLEGTNTDGLEYETFTVQNLNGETYAPFYDAILPGRYRVYVDGFSTEQPYRYDANFDFYTSVGLPFDLGATGESVLEITPGYNLNFPKLHRHTVSLTTPQVEVNGQLLAAEALETGNSNPIFRPYANQTIEIVSNPTDDTQVTPTSVTTTTDADGRFVAHVLPGLYGIRLPGMDDYFGDEVLIHVTNSAKASEANRTRSYKWPLAEAFPGLAEMTNQQAYRYFALDGIPIHAGREQFLELRVRRELYTMEAYGTENTDFSSKVIAISNEHGVVSIDYSPTIAGATQLTLAGSTTNYATTILPEPPQSFTNPLYARWDSLPPGDYSGISASIPNHALDASAWVPKTFFDWPTPGSAPDTAQAALFDLPNIPNNELPHRPLSLVQGTGFAVNMDAYTESPYQVFEWGTQEVNGEDVTGYHLVNTTGDGIFYETADGNYLGGFPRLGGSVVAAWTTGTNDDGDFYSVRIPAGGSLYRKGPSPTGETSRPSLSYSLLAEGIAATDHDLTINGANYAMSTSGRTFQTGTPISGLTEYPFVNKASGDNYFEQFQTNLRCLPGSGATVSLVVGLEQGMEVDATIQDMTVIGGGPIDIPAEGLPVVIRNRYGRQLATDTTDEQGKVNFQALPGYADYFLTIDAPGFTPVRTRLVAANATPSPSPGTKAKHTLTQNVELLPRPALHEPGIPLNRWGLFLPTVSRSGDVKIEDQTNLNTFDFFAAREVLTATWKVEVTPHTLNVTLPGFDNAGGTAQPDDTLSGPDAIVAAYLIDERRFQKAGFSGGTDPLENETTFLIPADDEPIDLAATVAAVTKIQGVQNGFSFSTTRQRRTFFDPADSIKIDSTSGRTVITGTMPLWDLPPGEFQPVIIVQTQRGAFRAYDVPYDGADAGKRLRGPELPPWFAGILDLLGIASGVASTQDRLKETLKEYVPEGNFIPLPEFSAKVTLDKDDDNVDAGYLKYTYTLAMAQEVGQDSKAAGLLGLGPGIIGAETKVEGTLATDGRTNTTGFTVTGTITKENLIDEAYGTKIAPIGGSVVSFEKPTGKVSTTASSNYPVGASEQDPLKFSLTATAGIGATAKVSANLNNYGRVIPYAGPVIGFLGDSELGKLDAFITGSATVAQTFTLETEFPREAKLQTRPRSEPVPRQSFLGQTKLKLDSELCIGVGFSTGLEFSSQLGTFGPKLGSGNITYQIGGGGCGVSDDIGTMELKLNTGGGWPLITEVSGEAKITASATVGIITGEWEFVKVAFKVQFGTDTIVTHYPFDTEFALANDHSEGEGLFVDEGPQLVDGLAAPASIAVNDPTGNALAYTARNTTTDADVLRLAVRAPTGEWGDPVEIPLALRIGVATALTLGDGRTLVAYTVLVDGQDPHDPYADHYIYGRIIETDGSVGAQTYVSYISNPPSQLVLAESGSLVELHVKAPATDGSEHYQQLFLIPFDKTASTWGATDFRQNESDDFDIHVASGGPSGADEIIMHWVTTSGIWKWRRTADGAAQTVAGTYATAPASATTASAYELVVPTTDNTLTRFTQPTGSGNPTAQNDLATDTPAAEVALVPLEVTPSGGHLLVWAGNNAASQSLSFLTYDLAGAVVGNPAAITENNVGVYSGITLAPHTSTTAYLYSRYTNGLVDALRFFELSANGVSTGNDADGDTLPDVEELRIVDADPNDLILSIEDVRDGDDFDGDGHTNGDEIRAGSDPTLASSTPNVPEITTPPADTTAAAGDPASFSVTADGDNLSYQWRRNGIAITGATNATLDLTDVAPTDAGLYDVTVSNDQGASITSTAARLTVTGGTAPASLFNTALGVAELADGHVAHLPLIIDGTGPKQVLLRALGPAINDSTVEDPALRLLDRSGAEIAANDNWESAQDSGTAAQSAATTAGALPLATGSLDAALVIDLNPGHYTLQGSATGPGLIYLEIFDLDTSSTPDSRLAAVGLHARTASQGFLPTLGFAVPQPGGRDLLTRHLGPALGTGDTLADPALTLIDATGATIGSNDNWGQGNLSAGLLNGLPLLPLSGGSLDAALLLQPAPGSYMLNASDATNGPGLGLLELIDPLPLALPDQLAVLIPPLPQQVTTGTSAHFSVLALGPAPLNYQWLLDGQPILDATASSLTIANAQEANEGDYTVQITDGNETLTPPAVTLTTQAPAVHDADTDGNFQINLGELLRVIELYNTRFGTSRTGRYKLQEGTGDGFAPDATTADTGTLSRHHSADTDRNAKLNLGELLRVIELYNTRSGTQRTGAYRSAPGTVDGFTPDNE